MKNIDEIKIEIMRNGIRNKSKGTQGRASACNGLFLEIGDKEKRYLKANIKNNSPYKIENNLVINQKGFPHC